MNLNKTEKKLLVICSILVVVAVIFFYFNQKKKKRIDRQIKKISSDLQIEKNLLKKIKKQYKKISEIIDKVGVIKTHRDIPLQEMRIFEELKSVVGEGNIQTKVISSVLQEKTVDFFFEVVVFAKTLEAIGKTLYAIEKVEKLFFVEKWELLLEDNQYKGIFLVKRIFIRDFV